MATFIAPRRDVPMITGTGPTLQYSNFFEALATFAAGESPDVAFLQAEVDANTASVGSLTIITSDNTVDINTNISAIAVNAADILNIQTEVEGLFAFKVDFITDNLLYRGEAIPGTATSAATWRIREITISAVDGDISTTWADGDSDFDNIWDDRLSLTYT